MRAKWRYPCARTLDLCWWRDGKRREERSIPNIISVDMGRRSSGGDKPFAYAHLFKGGKKKKKDERFAMSMGTTEGKPNAYEINPIVERPGLRRG